MPSMPLLQPFHLYVVVIHTTMAACGLEWAPPTIVLPLQRAHIAFRVERI